MTALRMMAISAIQIGIKGKQPSGMDPLLIVYEAYDRIIGDLQAFGQNRIIITTALSQVPNRKPHYQYRLIDYPGFLSAMGIRNFAVMPRMSRDFLVTFEDRNDLLDAQARLTAFQIAGKPLFSADDRGLSLFCQVAYFGPPEELGPITFDGVAQPWSLHMVLVSIENAIHRSTGYFMDLGRARSGESAMPLTDVFTRLSTAAKAEAKVSCAGNVAARAGAAEPHLHPAKGRQKGRQKDRSSPPPVLLHKMPMHGKASASRMNILLHDFCGHPFTLGLAVELAQRGHVVNYVYFASESGPKGDFAAAAKAAPTLLLHGLLPDIPYRKDAWLQRRRDDRLYAETIKALIARLAPSVVLSGNCPTEVQSFVLAGCRAAQSAFVYWMQDFYSIAATKILSRKLGLLGKAIGAYWRILDARHLRASDSIVLITEDFRSLAESMSGRKDRIEVIENWGTLKDIDTGADAAGWLKQTGIDLAGRIHFLYSGTLGLKHNPELLVQLAARHRSSITVTVVSNGASVPFLQQRLAQLGLEGNLRVMPLRPFEELSAMLASADVLVAMIEPDAGTFSVPSKVLSYLCAGRPVLLAAPADNLASRIVNRVEAGLVVSPDDVEAFLASAQQLLDAEARLERGVNGRRYAEQTFDLAAICARFEAVLAAAQASANGVSANVVSARGAVS